MVNREYIKSQIDVLPDDIIEGIDNFINHRITAYNKKTKKAIREAHQNKHKAKTFKNSKDLFKDLGI